MKKIVLFFLVIVQFAYSQDNNIDEFKVLRDSAFIIKANHFYNIYGKELNKNIDTENWKTFLKEYEQFLSNIYVLDESNYTFEIQNSSKNYTFKQIKIYDRENRKLLRKGIRAWRFNAYLKGDKLIFEIGERIVKCKDKKCTFGISGSSTIVFQYSCEERKWLLIKEEHTGI